MKTRILATVAAALTVAFAVPSFAWDTAAPGIEKRQQNQKDRIHSGIQDGSLTPGETARLAKEQVRIERHEQKFMSDGNFTPRERAIIHKELDHSSQHIYKARHNRRVAQ